MVMLLAMAGIFTGKAYSPSSEDVDNYKASIMSYVKMEGYMPKIDDDGDIVFKHDGDAYWVLVSPYDDGYYVTVMTMTSVSGRNINKVRKAMDEAARSIKFVKLFTSSNEDVVTTSYNWYCVSIADFKRMFANALSVVSSADSKLIKGILAD